MTEAAAKAAGKMKWVQHLTNAAGPYRKLIRILPATSIHWDTLKKDFITMARAAASNNRGAAIVEEEEGDDQVVVMMEEWHCRDRKFPPQPSPSGVLQDDHMSTFTSTASASCGPY